MRFLALPVRLLCLSLVASTAMADDFGPLSVFNPLQPTERLFWDVAAGDVDDDTDDDVVAVGFASPGSLPILVVFLGDGAGGLQAQPAITALAPARSLELADVDCDGDLDVITSTQVLLGTGTGTFGAPATLPGTHTFTERVDVGDFNADGLPDVASGPRVYLGDGAGGFSGPFAFAPGTRPDDVVVGDFDQDGELDVVVTASGSRIDVWFGAAGNSQTGPAGPVSFTGPTSLTTHDARGIDAGDVDGDGLLDIAWAHGFSSVSVRLGDGNGGFSPGAIVLDTSSSGGLVPSDVLLADVDMNGFMDLVAVHSDSGNIVVFENQGFGLAPQGPYPATTTWSLLSVVATDLDDDGALDLAVTGQEGDIQFGPGVGVHLNTCAWPFTDLGCALAASGDPVAPELVGSGRMIGLLPMNLSLEHALPSSPAILIVSSQQYLPPAPLNGGCLVPDVDVGLLIVVQTDCLGNVELPSLWPVGIPPGSVFFQYWIQDPAGPFGWTASNALEAVTS